MRSELVEEDEPPESVPPPPPPPNEFTDELDAATASARAAAE